MAKTEVPPVDESRQLVQNVLSLFARVFLPLAS